MALVAWLLTTRRVREATTHTAAFAGTLLLVYAPFMVWSQSEVLAAYERQSGRSITPESVWYLLLRPFDLAHVRTHISFSAGAPSWANVAAGILQAAVVLALVVAAARASTQRAAVALAALAPVAFLLTNRIFSPQFVLVAFAGGRSRPRSSCGLGASSCGSVPPWRGRAGERVRLPVRAPALPRHLGRVLDRHSSCSRSR